MMRSPILTFLLLIGVVAACQPMVIDPSERGTPEVQDVNDNPGFDPAGSITLTLTPFQPQTIMPLQTTAAPPTHTPLPTITATFSPTPPPRIQLLFTGVIVPARCVQAGIDARGDPYYPYVECSGADPRWLIWLWAL
jgi:hypothetical protein